MRREGKPLYKKLGAKEAAAFWTSCPHCGKLNDRHASLDPIRAPADGDVSFCSDCGKWSIYERNALGKLRPPTEKERDEIAGDEMCTHIATVWGSK